MNKRIPGTMEPGNPRAPQDQSARDRIRTELTRSMLVEAGAGLRHIGEARSERQVLEAFDEAVARPSGSAKKQERSEDEKGEAARHRLHGLPYRCRRGQ